MEAEEGPLGPEGVESVKGYGGWTECGKDALTSMYTS